MPLTLDLTLQPFGAAQEAEPAVRWCTACLKYQPLEEFRRNKRGKFGRKSECREAERAYSRERYATDPAVREAQRARTSTPEFLEAQRERYATDPEYAEARREARRKHRQDPANADYFTTKARRERAIKYGAAQDNHTASDLANAWEERDLTGCAVCGGPVEHFDHSMPLIRGGAHTVDNQDPMCERHNLAKSGGCPFRFMASEVPWLAPYLAPYYDSVPKLTPAEIQARVDAYNARHDAA